MGAAVTTCTSCFPQKGSTPSTKANETDSLVKYQPISMPSEESKTPSTASVEDSPSPHPYHSLLQTIDSKADTFITIIRSDPAHDSTLELVVDRDHCKVYTKNTDDGFVIRSEWKTKFSPKTYIDFIGNLEQRKHWDRNSEDMHLVEALTPQVSVFYQSYRSFFMISARDLVLACKKFPLEKAWIDTCSSIDFPACPAREHYIRAHITIGGYYVEQLEGEEPLQSRVVSYTEGSFGGVLPRSLVKKFSATNVPSFVKTLEEALDKFLAEESQEEKPSAE